MKPCAFKGVAAIALGLWLATSSASAEPNTPTPAGSPAKAAETGKGKKSKPRADTGDATLPPKTKVHKEKEIPFPVPKGRDALKVTVPSYDLKGNLTSLITSLKMHRVDNENVELEGTTFDLNGADGKDSYKVILPTSVLNLKTNIVTSKDPVTVQTKDFELTGERMEFNTAERSGELHGRVHMIIHNLKQVAAPGQPSADLK